MTDRLRDGRRIGRRRFLGAVAGVGALGALPRLSSAREEARDEPALVLLQLSGGNDGLSTVVPYGDDAYYAARPTISLAASSVHAIDDYRGWHPNLLGLSRLYQEGKLALVQGVGYPEPRRSHFKSYEVWHAADPRGRGRGEGWIGALIRTAYGDSSHPNRVVHVGGNPPYSLYSKVHGAAAFSTPDTYRWAAGGEGIRAFERAGESDSGSLDFLRGRLRDARASSNAIRDVVASYRTPVAYPANRFGDSLRTAAALVAQSPLTRVVSLDLRGFDTHKDELRRHDGLMRALDEGLTAFLADLERSQAGRRAAVLVFSEFGRRVSENGSGGTDHGCAGLAFAAGARIRGGLYGEHPSLTELDELGDLVFTTDFRSLYRAGIEACFDVDTTGILGGDYPALELFA